MTDITCMNTTFFDRKQRGRQEKKCTNKATWIIRKNGKEYPVCNKHKNVGIIVRKF